MPRYPLLLLALAACAPDPGGSSDDALSAWIRPHRAEGTVGPEGLMVRRGDEALTFRFSAWGRGELALTAAVEPERDGAFATLTRPGVTEHWAARPDGFAQSWALPERPPGAGPLTLEVAIEGGGPALVDADGLGATTRGEGGGLWRYEGLAAWGADGAPLDAWMAATPDGVALRIDDTDARYPLTVDPLVTPEAVQLEASDGVSGDDYGLSVAWADVDGDGYDDAIVGAYDHDAEGAIYVYYSDASGVDATTEDEIAPSGLASGDDFGTSVADAGDMNGDGYDDVVVGADGDSTVATNGGAIWICYGGSSGLDAGSCDHLALSPAATSDSFGRWVDGAGDVDGDGYDDVVVSAHSQKATTSNEGVAYVYYGSVSGLDPGREDALVRASPSASDYLGWGLGGAGDVDGDGYDDVIVGAYRADVAGRDSGAAYVYYGSATGIRSASEQELLASDIAAYDYFGVSATGVGDLDGDGYDDVVVGARGDDVTDGGADSSEDSGAAYVYYGSATGIDASSEQKIDAPDGVVDDHFGYGMGGGGDIDGDGYDDVVVGAYEADIVNNNAGAAYVYYGSAAGLDLDSEAEITPPIYTASFGIALDLGDADADGFADLLVGAYTSEDAFVFMGASDDADGDDVEFDVDCDDEDAAVGAPSTRYADLDGDGHGDPDASAEVCPDATGYADDDADCDDADAAVNPDTPEVCDGSDEDCDGAIDEGFDADSDGTADCFDTEECDGADNDGDGSIDEGFDSDSDGTADCFDSEECDGLDNDGDSSVDEGFDSDSDGTADCYDSEECDGADNDGDTHVDEGFDADSDGTADCYDTEECDGLDNDGDGSIDEGFDSDGDGTADCFDAEECDGLDNDGDGTVDEGSDADSDGTADCYDTEECDGLDNDGDGSVDEGFDSDSDGTADCFDVEECDGLDNDGDSAIDEDAPDAAIWYADADNDGYGDPATSQVACDQPSGHLADDTDCDDDAADTWPGADEYCDGVDTDCDGDLDEDDALDALTWYADSDSDGYGDPGASAPACEQPSGYVADDTDCDDGSNAAYPGADEYCDGVDTDCDGTLDEPDALDATTWYVDSDADGYGDAETSQVACAQPSGYLANDTDCDDDDPSTHPGAEDACGDGVDADCDGIGGPDGDEDGDGLTWAEERDLGTDDCDEDTDGDGLGDAEDPDPTTPEASDTGDSGEPGDTGSEDTGGPDDGIDSGVEGPEDTGDAGDTGGGEGKSGWTCSGAPGSASGALWVIAALVGWRRGR